MKLNGLSGFRSAMRCCLLVLAAATLAACAQEPKSLGGNNPDATAKDIRVTDIQIKAQSIDDERVAAELNKKMSKYMPLCAKGTIPHRLVVEVHGFKDGNVVGAVLVGTTARMHTTSWFIDLRNNKDTVKLSYDDKFSAGGLGGGLVMANAPGNLAFRLAKYFCERVFDGFPQEEYDPDGSSPSS